jgi:glutamate-ammonia-ligase adenylyltransferase
MAILAMGKLGGREMTVSSDLDLVFLYNPASDAEASDGEKPLASSQYYARLSQRYISAVTAKTAKGQLYEIDMRLRPSGNAGPIATPLSGFMKYYRESAWTWEHMALTRARVVAGSAPFRDKIESGILEILTQARDSDGLMRDVAAMRKRIGSEKPAKTIWSVKYLRGGLIDLEFLAQYLQLRYAHRDPTVLATGTQEAFTRLAAAGYIEASLAAALIDATRFFRQLQGSLRLTVGPAFDADSLPQALQSTLARAAGMSDFMALRSRLVRTAEAVHQVFVELLEEPASKLTEAQVPTPGREEKT